MLKKHYYTPLPQARRDALLPELRSRFDEILNVLPRKGARPGALGVGGCNRYAFGFVFLRPRWKRF